ncbi:MAG: hypothetical protein A3F13_04740 [Gammaproteobacteria bacterium RIFCSPHIGHO2_12_FULL_40_19]|nr:MAG: hypothetical protein A3F13_04740 [Gammaproteobacteria bacterium RIFCSPHIGHO2_12_FULL_40_19]
MTIDAIIPTENGFRVHGRVAFDNVFAVRMQGQKLLAKFPAKHGVIEVDLSDMRDEDASSFSLLLCFVRCAKKKQNTLSFTHPPVSLQRMRKMFGLTNLMVGVPLVDRLPELHENVQF